MADFAVYHTALEAAINEQLTRHQVACDIVRDDYYRTESGKVIQPVMRVKCEGSLEGVVLSFNHPTHREDGSLMPLNEIAGYEIRTVDVNGLKSQWLFEELKK